jgi:hypothetical protein
MAKYTATFEPQAWINDYAVPVDPQGPTTWDCTAFVQNPPEWVGKDLEARVRKGIRQEGAWLDKDDMLVNDPEAPDWIRAWAEHGPFTITVEASAAYAG